MNLIFRRMRPADIPICHRMILHPYVYDGGLYEALPGLWRTLIADGRIRTTVMEDIDVPGGEICGFGSCSFLRDDFVDTAFAGKGAPYLTRTITRQLLSGGQSPLLFPDEIRRDNSAGGLNHFTVYAGGKSPDAVNVDEYFFKSPENRAVRDKFVEGLRLFSAGYQFRTMVVTAYGDDQLRWNLNSGYRLKDDYREAFRSAKTPILHPPGFEPYLLGATRAEATVNEGTFLSLLFAYTPPKFFFSAGEQEIFEAALEGFSDPEAADELAVSLATIRKRWQNVYDKIHDLLPNFFDDAPAGAQKKRRVLAYLRSHPEELRPTMPKP